MPISTEEKYDCNFKLKFSFWGEPELTYVWRKVNTESIRFGQNFLENPIPFLADAANLLVSLEINNPEDDVPAGAAMTTGLEAATERGGALDHEHVLLVAVLDDVGGGEQAQRLFHMTCQHSWWTFYFQCLNTDKLW